MRIMGTIDAVLTGTPVDYARGERSAIAKTAVAGPVAVGSTGLVGDAQGDPVNHGGPAKALHHYARDHYPYWVDRIGSRAPLQQPGAFGENLSTYGITEADVCIGDRLAVGTAVLRVSQGRRPCWKLNQRFGVADMSRKVLTSGRTGWYYAVDTPGLIAADDEIVLIDRPHPDWPLSRLMPMVLRRVGTPEELAEAVTLPLPGSWIRTLRTRLEHGAADAADWMR